MLWPIYKRSSELSPIPSGAPWNPAKVQQHPAPCASPHIPLLPCCTNPGACPPSHSSRHHLSWPELAWGVLLGLGSQVARAPGGVSLQRWDAGWVEAHPPHKLSWYFSHNTRNMNHKMHFLGFNLSFWPFLLPDVRQKVELQYPEEPDKEWRAAVGSLEFLCLICEHDCEQDDGGFHQHCSSVRGLQGWIRRL